LIISCTIIRYKRVNTLRQSRTDGDNFIRVSSQNLAFFKAMLWYEFDQYFIRYVTIKASTVFYFTVSFLTYLLP